MNLAGFDTGSRFTGWCVGDGHGPPECGAWAFDPTGRRIGAMVSQFHRPLVRLLQDVDRVAFEAPILVVNKRYVDAKGNVQHRTDDREKLRKLYALTGHLEWVCDDMGIPHNEVTLQAAKKELAGFHRAEKADMVAAALKLGVILPDGPGKEDAADALAVWLLLLRATNRNLSSRFDAALYRSRGALL